MGEVNEKHASKRLSEIISVLNKHRIITGLTPVILREILEDLGPTYVKFGQIMSMRSDILSNEYCQELEKLRTDVAPLDYQTIRYCIEEELATSINEVFLSVDKEPLGSASIAQVHRAVLLSGEKVVLKIQRPHIYETMEADIKLIRKACSIIKLAAGTGNLLDFKAVVEELWRTSQLEMDFIKEAENIDRFRENQQDIAYILVPRVYHEYTTHRLLTMDDVGSIQIDNHNELLLNGYDMREIAKNTAENYCKQVLDDGLFHADPHPGNIHIIDGKIAFIDFGMMGTVTPVTQQILTKGIKAILDDDIYDLQDAFLMLVKTNQQINETQLISQLNNIVEKYKQIDFGDFNFGPLIEGLLVIVKSNKIAVPSDLTILCRSLITMEGTLGKVEPSINLLEVLANHMRIKWQRELSWKTQTIHILRDIYTSLKKGIASPSIFYDVLKLLKNGHLTINHSTSQSEKDLTAQRHNYNHIVVALLIGFIYISSSILVLSPLPKVILGLPFLSFLGYLIATILMILLLWKMEK